MGGKPATGVPRGYWSFSWVAEDDLNLASNSISGEQEAVGPPLLLRSRVPHVTSPPLLSAGRLFFVSLVVDGEGDDSTYVMVRL